MSGNPQHSTAWRVSATSFGPIRFGMSSAEALAVAPLLQIPKTRQQSCDYATLPNSEGELFFLLVDDRVMRVDVVTDTIYTTQGVHVGDSEAQVTELYAGRVSSEPHKYTQGHYLVVKPTAATDSLNRVIFETDGTRVTRYRAGLMPVVQWVEGCS